MSVRVKDSAAQRRLEELLALGDQSDDGLERRIFAVKVGSIDEEARSVRVVASTTAIDSYDEIVDQDWDLERYRANPVVLWAHNRSGGWLSGPSAEEILPIGHAADVGVVSGSLEATLIFVDANATPLAEKVWQGFKQGSIRAVSVGFNPRDVRHEVHDGVDVYRLSGNELFEISPCPIGANPQAVAKSAGRTERLRQRALKQTPAAKRGAEEKTTMDPEKLKAELDAKIAELATVRAEKDAAVAAGNAASAAATKQIGDLTVERDAALERATKAEDQLVDAEVQSFVGKKLTPAEVPSFTKLRKIDKALFDEQIALKADISALTTDVLPKTSKTRTDAQDRAKAASERAASKLQG